MQVFTHPVVTICQGIAVCATLFCELAAELYLLVTTLCVYFPQSSACLLGVLPSLIEHASWLRRYAQQEPELPGTSTVWEFLRFHARLRMPEEQRKNNAAEAYVWGVISQLGLNKVLPCHHAPTAISVCACEQMCLSTPVCTCACVWSMHA